MDLSMPPFTSPVQDDDGEWILSAYLMAAQKFELAHYLRVRAILAGETHEATHSQALAQPAQFALA
jgi:hypothetical protein